MKKTKKILSIGLAIGMVASMALTANAAPIEDSDYIAVKGNKYLISSVTTYSGTNDKIINNYTVDENYRVIGFLTTYDEAGQQTDAGGEEYVLNTDGSVKEIKYYTVSSGGEKSYNKILAYEYNANGKVTKSTQTKIDTTQYVRYVLSYEYDSNGNETKYTSVEYDESGQTKWTNIVEQEYDTENKLTKKTTQLNGVNNMRYTYEYNTDGKLKTQYVEMWDVDEWGKSRKIEYTYSADGLTVTQNAYAWAGTDYRTEAVDTASNTYDANGNRLCYEKPENYKEEYTYDEFGNPLTYKYLSYNENTRNFDLGWEQTFNYGVIGGTEGAAAQAKSPKTSDTTPVAIALTGVIALGALVVSKKKA